MAKHISKTKIGSALICTSAILGTLGGIMTGSLDLVSGFQSLMVEVGALVTMFGLRDLKIFN